MQSKVNVVVLEVPAAVVTKIVLFTVAFLGTIAVISVAETTVNLLASTPPILTLLALPKLVPVMVIVSPLLAVVGEKDVIVGRGNCVTC